MNPIELQSSHNELKPNWLSQESPGKEVCGAPLEHFVDAYRAAQFLSLSRKHILKLAIRGEIPAHPLGLGQRKTWRFLLSELRSWVLGDGSSPKASNSRTIGGGGSRKGGQ